MKKMKHKMLDGSMMPNEEMEQMKDVMEKKKTMKPKGSAQGRV